MASQRAAGLPPRAAQRQALFDAAPYLRARATTRSMLRLEPGEPAFPLFDHGSHLR